MDRVCESCGRDEDDLAAVHRIYIDAESWHDIADAIEREKVTVLDEIELWCFSCQSSYPHEAAAEG